MWVLAEGRTGTKDSDYHYVGNATASYYDSENGLDYHIGVTTLGELVCSLASDQTGTRRGIPAADIPETAKRRLLKHGIDEIGTLVGHQILAVLDVGVPTDIEPIDFNKLFGGTPEEQAAEQAKNRRWEQIADELRQTLDIEEL